MVDPTDLYPLIVVNVPVCLLLFLMALSPPPYPDMPSVVPPWTPTILRLSPPESLLEVRQMVTWGRPLSSVRPLWQHLNLL